MPMWLQPHIMLGALRSGVVVLDALERRTLRTSYNSPEIYRVAHMHERPMINVHHIILVSFYYTRDLMLFRDDAACTHVLHDANR